MEQITGNLLSYETIERFVFVVTVYYILFIKRGIGEGFVSSSSGSVGISGHIQPMSPHRSPKNLRMQASRPPWKTRQGQNPLENLRFARDLGEDRSSQNGFFSSALVYPQVEPVLNPDLPISPKGSGPTGRLANFDFRCLGEQDQQEA